MSHPGEGYEAFLVAQVSPTHRSHFTVRADQVLLFIHRVRDSDVLKLHNVLQDKPLHDRVTLQVRPVLLLTHFWKCLFLLEEDGAVRAENCRGTELAMNRELVPSFKDEVLGGTVIKQGRVLGFSNFLCHFMFSPFAVKMEKKEINF